MSAILAGDQGRRISVIQDRLITQSASESIMIQAVKTMLGSVTIEHQDETWDGKCELEGLRNNAIWNTVPLDLLQFSRKAPVFEHLVPSKWCSLGRLRRWNLIGGSGSQGAGLVVTQPGPTSYTFSSWLHSASSPHQHAFLTMTNYTWKPANPSPLNCPMSKQWAKYPKHSLYSLTASTGGSFMQGTAL